MNNPKFEDIRILWMTNEQWIVDKTTKNFPSVWFIYEGIMHWGLSRYEFKWFEDYSDFSLPSGKEFNQWLPGKQEWEYMLEFGYDYRLFDYNKAILEVDDLDDWCDFELDFVREWHRNKRIDDVLN